MTQLELATSLHVNWRSRNWVAFGRINREIAERLTVGYGTALRHVANILLKLDLSSRAELASWIVTPGLLPAAQPTPTTL